MPDLGITPWRLVVLCIGVLFLRRIPAILALYKLVPEISSWKEALFCGHFGEDPLHVLMVLKFLLTPMSISGPVSNGS